MTKPTGLVGHQAEALLTSKHGAPRIFFAERRMSFFDQNPMGQTGSGALFVERTEQVVHVGMLFRLVHQGQVDDHASKSLPDQRGHVLGGRQWASSPHGEDFRQVSEGRMITLGIDDAHRVIELDEAFRKKPSRIRLSHPCCAREQHVDSRTRQSRPTAIAQLP